MPNIYVKLYLIYIKLYRRYIYIYICREKQYIEGLVLSIVSDNPREILEYIPTDKGTLL